MSVPYRNYSEESVSEEYYGTALIGEGPYKVVNSFFIFPDQYFINNILIICFVKI